MTAEKPSTSTTPTTQDPPTHDPSVPPDKGRARRPYPRAVVRSLAGVVLILLGVGIAVAVDRNQSTDTTTEAADPRGPGVTRADGSPTGAAPSPAEIAGSDVAGAWRMRLAVFESTGFFGDQIGQSVEKTYTIRSDCVSTPCVLRMAVSGTAGDYEVLRQVEEYVVSASGPQDCIVLSTGALLVANAGVASVLIHLRPTSAARAPSGAWRATGLTGSVVTTFDTSHPAARRAPGCSGRRPSVPASEVVGLPPMEGGVMRVAVVGAGSWGTAMAAMLSAKVPTTLWARRPELAAAIQADGHNPDYLPDLRLPAPLRATADLAEALDGADVVVMAVPSHGFRAVLTEGRPNIRPGAAVVSLTKGVEQVALRRMSEIVAELMPGQPFAVLTGPNLVDEIVAGQPTASVVATADEHLANELQHLFTTGSFRVYTNPDVVGCELGGALKNVIAIAAGIADGMGFGDNTRGAVVTRGLAELARLGVALGGQPVTFSGLTGMGDLVATCTSRHSRNRWVGEQLSKGHTLVDILAGTRMVAEGVRTSAAVVDLAGQVGVEMPIAEQVVAVLHHGKPPAEVVTLLMGRGAKPEFGPGAFSPTLLARDTAPSQIRGRTIRA